MSKPTKIDASEQKICMCHKLKHECSSYKLRQIFTTSNIPIKLVEETIRGLESDSASSGQPPGARQWFGG